MHTEGRHLILDVWFSRYCEKMFKDSLDDLVFSTFQVVNTAEYFFEPQGFTRVFLLKESHVAVHTYPEHAYVSVDIYICNPAYDLEAISHSIRSLFPIVSYKQQILERGLRPSLRLLDETSKGASPPFRIEEFDV